MIGIKWRTKTGLKEQRKKGIKREQGERRKEINLEEVEWTKKGIGMETTRKSVLPSGKRKKKYSVFH